MFTQIYETDDVIKACIFYSENRNSNMIIISEYFEQEYNIDESFITKCLKEVEDKYFTFSNLNYLVAEMQKRLKRGYSASSFINALKWAVNLEFHHSKHYFNSVLAVADKIEKR